MRFTHLAGALGEDFIHTVLSLNGAYEAAALVPPGAPVQYLELTPAASLPARLLQYRRILSEIRPDLLMTYNWGAMEFALARRLAPCPHLHHEDGFGPEEVVRQFRRRIWLRRIALSGSHLLAPSKVLEAIARTSWRLAPGRIHYIPNGVPLSHAPAAALPVETGPTRIAWVGGLRAEKNPLRMLEAFAPLRDRASLLIIGDGPERGALEAAIARMGLANQILMLGNRTDARSLLSQCDVLALSSDTEQMPLVVLEAMAEGLPVAAVDVGDVGLMVANENRPYVTPIDAEALSAALAVLVADPDLRREIGAANRRRAQAHYGLEAMVANHHALITRLALSAPRRRQPRPDAQQPSGDPRRAAHHAEHDPPPRRSLVSALQ